MKRTVFMIASLIIAFSAMADDEMSQADGAPPSSRLRTYNSGLSVFANASAIWADNVNANFYAGLPQNVNTINRVLHSNYYGQQIWQSLFSQGLISSAVGNYEQLRVEEYPQMYYPISYQIGMGVRNDYENGWGWMLRFDIAKLTVLGAFNLSSNNGTGILSNNRQYIRCGMMGQEDRINIDLALTKMDRRRTMAQAVTSISIREVLAGADLWGWGWPTVWQVWGQ